MMGCPLDSILDIYKLKFQNWQWVNYLTLKEKKIFQLRRKSFSLNSVSAWEGNEFETLLTKLLQNNFFFIPQLIGPILPYLLTTLQMLFPLPLSKPVLAMQTIASVPTIFVGKAVYTI